ncbi:MAG: hypothetical protein ACYCS7_04935 [Acidimicrobiales bacterium]
MTLGVADKQGDLHDEVARLCDEALPERSIYTFLRRERDHLFPDEANETMVWNQVLRRGAAVDWSLLWITDRLVGLEDFD